MVNTQKPDPVQQYLGDMLALERQLEALVDHLVPVIAIQPQVADAFGRYQRTVRAHRTALASDWDYPTLQVGIRIHQAGDAIRLRVLRPGGGLEDIILTRPYV